MSDQLALPFHVEPLTVVRVRADGTIEARWPSLDLCMTFATWDWALTRLDDVCAFLNIPLVLRIRP